MDDFANTSFDFVIIGGGTAGLVLAARLSENENFTVAVIEAGSSRLGDPKVDLPAGAALMLGNSDYDWNFRSVPQVCFDINDSRIRSVALTGVDSDQGQDLSHTKREDAWRVKRNQLYGVRKTMC